MTLFTDTLFGGNIVHDVGYLESGLCSSNAQVVICNEIINWLKAFMKKVEISDETLALDLIHEMGPTGQFMQTRHTRENFKKRWYPSLFERSNFKGWQKKGSKTLDVRASEKVDEILAAHKAEPLPKDVSEHLNSIVKNAEQEIN